MTTPIHTRHIVWYTIILANKIKAMIMHRASLSSHTHRGETLLPDRLIAVALFSSRQDLLVRFMYHIIFWNLSSAHKCLCIHGKLATGLIVPIHQVKMTDMYLLAAPCAGGCGRCGCSERRVKGSLCLAAGAVCHYLVPVVLCGHWCKLSHQSVSS